MLEIVYALRYTQFDDIKGCDFAKKMWDAIEKIYGGDKNVVRAKYKSIRGKLMILEWKKVRILFNFVLE